MNRLKFSIAAVLIGASWSAATARGDSIIVGHRISDAARQREIAANEHRYQTLVALRENDPMRFDRLHPFYGLLLTNQDFFDKYVDRWQSNAARFEYYHPCAWRVLDGGVHLAETPSTVVPVPMPTLPPGFDGTQLTPPVVAQSANPPPNNPPTTNPPTEPLPPSLPGPIVRAAVPEPSTTILLLSGLGVVLLARTAARFRG